MKRWLKRLLVSLLILVIVLVCVVVLLISTNAGLSFLTGQLNRIQPAGISVESTAGRILGPLQVNGFKREAEDGTILVKSIALDWQSSALWRRSMNIQSAKIAGVVVDLIPQPQAEPPANTEPFSLPETLSLPIDVNLEELNVTDISIKTSPDAQVIVIDAVVASAHYSRDDTADVSLSIDSDMLQLRTKLEAQTQGSYPISGNANWILSLDNLAPVAGTLNVEGDLDNLKVKPSIAAPYGVELQAVISDPLKDLSIAMSGSIATSDLSLIKSDLPPYSVNADLNFNGAPDNAESSVNVVLSGLMPDDIKLTLNTQIQQKLLLIDALQVQVDNQTLSLDATGTVDLSGAQPVVDLDTKWRDVQWPFDAEPMVTSKSGTLRLQGSADNIRASVQAQVGNKGQLEGDASVAKQDIKIDLNWNDLSWPLDGSQVKSANGNLLLAGTLDEYGLTLTSSNEIVGAGPVTLTTTGFGSDKQVTLPVIQGTALAGKFSGRAKVEIAPALALSMDIKGSGFNPGLLSAEVPGKLGFDVSVSGESINESLNIAVKKLNVDGTLRDLPLKIRAVVNTVASRVDVKNLSIDSGPSTLLVKGVVDETMALTWNLDSPDLSTFYSGLSGRIKSAGSVNGTVSMPVVKATIDGSGIGFEGNSVKLIKVVADVDPRAKGNILFDLAVADIEAPGVTVTSFTTKASGQIDSHNITLTGRSNQGDIDLKLKGGLKQSVWNFAVNELKLAPPDFDAWSLSSPAIGAVNKSQIKLENLCLESGTAKLCSDLQRSDASVDLTYALSNFPVSYLRQFIPEDLFVEGSVNSQGQVQLPTGGDVTAKLETTLNGIGVQVLNPDEQRVSVLSLGPSEINIMLERTGLYTDLLLDLGEQGRLDGKLAAKGSVDALATAPVTGSLTGEISDFEFLVALVPDIESIAGKFRSDITIKGTADKPIVGGGLYFENGAVQLATPGLDLKNINAVISAKSGTVLDLNADASSGSGQLNVTGTIDLADEKPAFSVAIKGKDFSVLNTLDARAAISPQLDVVVRNDSVYFNGDVGVPVLEITPKKIPAGVVLANEDQVIVTNAPVEGIRAPIPVKGTVNIILGDDVRVDAFGLQAKLSGRLRVNETPGRETTATGKLTIDNGTFRAYGQNLQVQNGQILYAGGPISQPGFDIEAIRKVTSDLQVGVRARGAIAKPQFTLFSTPPMTESEQMSYLVLGRPLEDNSPSENSAVRQAAMALGVAGGTLLTEKFGNKLGLDSVAIGSELRESGEQAALVVGKYLSPKLFVSYGVGLFEPVSTLRLNYSINRNVKLVSETTESRSGGDIVFTFESNK